MRSMTGFGHREHQDRQHRLTLTLKSYNNRFLDILVYLPAFLSPLEQRLREFLSTRIRRGRVELYVKAAEPAEGAGLAVDTAAVRSYAEAIRKIAEAAGIRERVRLSHLLRIEGILKPEASVDMEEYWRFLEPQLEEVFAQYDGLRLSEGKATRRDIETLLGKIKAEIARIEARASELEARITQSLRSRFEELLGNGIDESRILSETAVALMKSDINEELVRIRSHLSSFESALAEEEAVGKKLDFICQEMNREFNTIGAKNLLSEVDASVVVLKDTVEKIREQLRNVE